MRQQLGILAARLEHLRAAAGDQRQLALNASGAARAVLARLPASLSRVEEVLRREESLVRDSERGLDAVVKVTLGLDSLEEIHSMAVALESEQHALLIKTHELHSLSARISAALERASTAAGALRHPSGGGGVPLAHGAAKFGVQV